MKRHLDHRTLVGVPEPPGPRNSEGTQASRRLGQRFAHSTNVQITNVESDSP